MQILNGFIKRRIYLITLALISWNCFINGDLNCYLLKQPLENHAKHLAHNCESHQLTQLVNNPTRVTPISRILNKVITTTEPGEIVECDVISRRIADRYNGYCFTSYKSLTRTGTH